MTGPHDLTPSQERAVRLAIELAALKLALDRLADDLDPATAAKIRAIIGTRPDPDQTTREATDD